MKIVGESRPNSIFFFVNVHTSDLSPRYMVILRIFMVKLTINVQIKQINDFRAMYSNRRFCLLITDLDIRICRYSLHHLHEICAVLPHRYYHRYIPSHKHPTEKQVGQRVAQEIQNDNTVAPIAASRMSIHDPVSQVVYAYHCAQHVPPTSTCCRMIFSWTECQANSYGQSANRTVIRNIPTSLIHSACRSDSRMISRINMTV